MSDDASPVTDPTCFHHRDRTTGRRCTRCGRAACADCLEDQPVGAHCWECRRSGQPSAVERARRRVRGQPLAVTKALVGANVAVFVLMAVAGADLTGGGGRGNPLFDWALHAPAIHDGEWWRIVTSGFIHYGVLHILFNGLILYQVGLVLEPGVGHLRFAAIYGVALLTGSLLALVLDPFVFTGGASGAVFGVAGAATLALWRRGVTFWNTGFGPLLAINLALTFIVPRISIGGHLGGLAGGILVGWLLVDSRGAGWPAPVGWLVTGAVAVLAAVGSVVAASVAVTG